MDRIVKHGRRYGSVSVPSSKSQLHRLMIAAAASDGGCRIAYSGGQSRDMKATAGCLNLLGAACDMKSEGVICVSPMQRRPQGGYLPAGESGSTLRFLIPFAGAYGIAAGFRMEGRLAKRPLAPFDDELMAHGMQLAKASESGADGGTVDLIRVSGQLLAGDYSLPGNISSQYISGLLMALPLLEGSSRLEVTGRIESSAYIDMTLDVLAMAGVKIEREGQVFVMEGGQRPHMPEAVSAEGDWSNAAFFLCMGALSDAGVSVTGLSPESRQGDRAVLDILRSFGAKAQFSGNAVTVKKGSMKGLDIDASQIPDLVPALSVIAACADGATRIYGASRLRLKESDRLESTAAMLRSLGGSVQVSGDGLVIEGRGGLEGGSVDAFSDHRIAMAAAEAACACGRDVEIRGSECVAKSYPRFFEDMERLGLVK